MMKARELKFRVVFVVSVMELWRIRITMDTTIDPVWRTDNELRDVIALLGCDSVEANSEPHDRYPLMSSGTREMGERIQTQQREDKALFEAASRIIKLGEH
jgi:hypothetical protein